MSLLGQAFKTDSKCLCHDLEAGWWPKEKPGTVFAFFFGTESLKLTASRLSGQQAQMILLSLFLSAGFPNMSLSTRQPISDTQDSTSTLPTETSPNLHNLWENVL